MSGSMSSLKISNFPVYNKSENAKAFFTGETPK